MYKFLIKTTDQNVRNEDKVVPFSRVGAKFPTLLPNIS